MESRQRSEHLARSPQLPDDVRERRPRFPEQLDTIREKHHAAPLQVADYRDMQALRQRETALLETPGWSDRKTGKARIPIEAALKLIEDPAKAKAYGIIARELKEAK